MIDILLATYNGERFLSEQIDSIIQQSFQDWRLLVSDDGSQDGTMDLLKKFQTRDSRIVLLPKSSCRLGVQGNFSKLCEVATAPYIMLCDQDDQWFPNKIEISLNALQNYEKKYSANMPLLVHSDLHVVDESLKIISPSFWKYSRIDPKCSSLNRLLVQNVVTGCTSIINQALLKKASPIPSSACMHDWWLALVASLFGKIEFIPAATMSYRQHSKNQLGARPYGLGRIKQEGFAVISKHKVQKAKQALQTYELEKRYGNELSEYEKEILNGYKKYHSKSPIRRFHTIYRYDFYKHGFLRNALNLFG